MNYYYKEILYFCYQRLPHLLWGRLNKNLVRAHWGRHFKNFGDCLQPYILKHYGLTPYFVTSNQKTDVVLAGSILQWVPSDYSGFIIGTGAKKGDYSFEKASIWALRGKLTYQHVKPQPTHCVFGDIGLLMPFVFNEKVVTKYDLGIVPHFTDYQNVLFTRLRSWGGKNNQRKAIA